jgi:hypothetical protein
MWQLRKGTAAPDSMVMIMKWGERTMRSLLLWYMCALQPGEHTGFKNFVQLRLLRDSLPLATSSMQVNRNPYPIRRKPIGKSIFSRIHI